jgi:hypothetical protein
VGEQLEVSFDHVNEPFLQHCGNPGMEFLPRAA